MNNAVNTIARGIEAGALKAGASQYLEAIEAAKQQLADNQVLVVQNDDEMEITTNAERTKGIILYTFAESVTEIMIFTKGLKEVYVPQSTKAIISDGLANQEILEKVELPQGLEFIGDSAFSQCIKLTLHVPDTVTRIEPNAFKNVPHIYYNGPATWEEGNTYWGALAMN